MKLEALEVPLNLSKKGFDIGIAGAIAGVTALAGVVGGMIKITFDWANGLDKLGDVMGGTNEEIAAMAFVAKKSGVGVEKFAQANVILEKGLLNVWGGLDKTGTALYQYGINVKNANGTVKTQTQLTDEIAKKYASLATQQEKVNFLTEIYGKSGAELVDFFDTLNGEGGISAVEDKVKRLGLAIDPARFEMFNRNLEELKLIGTGIAVSFTEKLMPSLEGLLGWATDFINAPIAEKLSMLADPLKLLFNFSDWFKRSVEEVDWTGLSQELAARIQSVDWANVGSYVREGVKNVIQGIVTIVSEIDWQALANSTGAALKGMVAGLSGYPDWNSFATDFNSKLNHAFDHARNYSMKDFQSDWAKFIDGLKEAFQTFLDWANNQANMTPGRNVTGGFNTTSTGGNTGNNKNNKRASGGAVIAGQTYDVAEFSQPEKFTPTQSGRVDPVSNAVVIDEEKIGKAVARHMNLLFPAMIALAKA